MAWRITAIPSAHPTSRKDQEQPSKFRWTLCATTTVLRNGRPILCSQYPSASGSHENTVIEEKTSNPPATYYAIYRSINFFVGNTSDPVNARDLVRQSDSWGSRCGPGYFLTDSGVLGATILPSKSPEPANQSGKVMARVYYAQNLVGFLSFEAGTSVSVA